MKKEGGEEGVEMLILRNFITLLAVFILFI